MKSAMVIAMAVLVMGHVAYGQLPPGFGPDSGANKTAEQLVPVQVMADVDVIHPGQKFHLAVAFEIERPTRSSGLLSKPGFPL